jgi:hypothetical protein
VSSRVLIFVEDPGAANGVCSLPAALAKRGVGSLLCTGGAAWTYLQGKVEPLEQLGPNADAGSLLDREAPSAVLVGTSENPETLGLGLVDEARRRAIPCAAFVDAFANAAYRFRGTSNDPLAHCPDRVFVPDSWTRDEFALLGLAQSRIVITGHPHYDDVLLKAAELEREGQHAVRRRVLPRAPQGVQVVTFAAEISTGLNPTQFQRSPEYTLHGRGGRHGRTEIVLEELATAVSALRPRPHFVLRLHPKNTLDEFGPLLDEVDEVSHGGSALDVAFASDLVAGMTSTILIEASLLGRATLSIVPRPLERDWLPTIRAGTTAAATTRAEIARELQDWSASSTRKLRPFALPGATDRLADALVELASKELR